MRRLTLIRVWEKVWPSNERTMALTLILTRNARRQELSTARMIGISSYRQGHAQQEEMELLQSFLPG